MIVVFAQATGRLGGGGAVAIPFGRIAVAFLMCALIAVLAILLIRQRTGRGDVAGWLRSASPRRGAIEVVEVRRLTMHADIGLVRHGGREYLLVLQAGRTSVLREIETPADGPPDGGVPIR